jgi:hypothetical protein
VTVDGDVSDDPTYKSKQWIWPLGWDCVPSAKVGIIHTFFRIQMVTQNVIGDSMANFSVFCIQLLDGKFRAGKEQIDDFGIFQHGVTFSLYYISRN